MSEQAPLRNTFKKTERLHHRTLVEGLFSRGKSIYACPLRMVWRQWTPEELDKAFCAAATEAGFVNLKGHRLVGGMRASIYNAMPAKGIDELVVFMEKFRRENA